jgi:monooxygenase
MRNTEVDVLIIGAGLSGIGMAAQLTRLCPNKCYAVLERREALGGTWDYFRYPGIRCDSDMFTLGYAFRPWTGEKMITDADSIRTYITDTAREHGVLDHIRYGHKVVRSSWSTSDARWTVTAELEATGEPRTFSARFVVDCTGYYSYDEAHRPRFEGQDTFKGDIVHAQFWDPSYDYSGKKVVVIGSGATAVTLVPAMSERAGHVTMLQRSPTYMMSLPAKDVTAKALRRFLPEDAVASIVRNRNTFLQVAIYNLALRYPEPTKRLLLGRVKRQLGPDADMTHFTPHYNPWEERLCAVPDGDFFKAVRKGRVSMVTDKIERFTPEGIVLESGQSLEADLIVLATGLTLQVGGGAEMFVDGEKVDRSERLTYRSTMIADVPNFAMVFGYVNASWTRKADLVFEFVCRLLRHMDRTGHRQVTPRGATRFESDEPFVQMRSGYLQRAAGIMPRQGTRPPWRSVQNVFYETVVLRYAPLRDGFLRFSNRSEKRGRRARGGAPRDLTAPVRSSRDPLVEA